MSTPLDDIASYSAFIYTLAERHPFVTSSPWPRSHRRHPCPVGQGRIDDIRQDWLSHRDLNQPGAAVRGAKPTGCKCPAPSRTGLAATRPPPQNQGAAPRAASIQTPAAHQAGQREDGQTTQHHPDDAQDARHHVRVGGPPIIAARHLRSHELTMPRAIINKPKRVIAPSSDSAPKAMCSAATI